MNSCKLMNMRTRLMNIHNYTRSDRCIFTSCKLHSLAYQEKFIYILIDRKLAEICTCLNETRYVKSNRLLTIYKNDLTNLVV